MNYRHLLVSALLLTATVSATRAADAPLPVTITVDANKPTGPLKPIWRYYGYDEPNYTYSKNGTELIKMLSAGTSSPAYFRTHSLLVTGDGVPAMKWGSTNAYTLDPAGKPLFDWTLTDRIFDTYLARGSKPLVQVGFMPEALSTHPQPYKHDWKPGDPYNKIYTGWSYPPNDYAKWAELVNAWATHCIEKYGRDEVRSWPWELWNEPNIGYFHGTIDDYCKLYDYTADALKRADPQLKIGGAEIAGAGSKSAEAFQRTFLDHCLTGTNAATGKTGTPLDLISFHAKGSPKFVDNHVVMGIAAQLNAINTGFATVAAYPTLKDKPIIIGESDPDGCAACPAEVDPQNGYRMGALYASYTVEQIVRTLDLADQRGVNIAGAVTWAFEFENQPYFVGLRQLSTNGVPLPVLNAFRLLNRMSSAGTQRIAATSTADRGIADILKNGVRTAPDIAALATRDANRLCVLLWNYHDDARPGPDATISLDIAGAPTTKDAPHVTRWSLDDTHSNSYTAWQKLGSPANPTPEQYAQLLQSSALEETDAPKPTITEDHVKMTLSLPTHGLTLIELKWPS